MASNLKLADAFVNAAVDAGCALCNGGKLQVFDGAQPTDADTAVGAQVKLAELTWNATAFAGAADGVATANAITTDGTADATGTAAWFRALTSADGKMFDGTVGTSGCDLNINSVAIQINAAVSCTAFTFTMPQTA